jgi:hypothetical protein
MAARISATIRMAIGFGAVAMLAACAGRGARDDVAEPQAPRKTAEERMDQARRGMADAAIAPLKDVGLVRPNVPLTLQDLRYPYDVASLGGSCVHVSYELGRIDAALGPESYQPKARTKLSERGMDEATEGASDLMRGATTGVIPFRGVVRNVSGAEKAARDAARARQLGEMRRAFLRGYGAALGCANLQLPAPPPPEKPKDKD